MYQTILIALSLDQGHGPQAVELARRIGTENAKIAAVHVIDQVPGYSRYFIENADKEKILQSARQGILERTGGQEDIEPVVLEGHPGRTVTDYADEIGADCIIVGAHRPGLTNFFLGSTAARIMRYTKCSVHVLRPGQQTVGL